MTSSSFPFTIAAVFFAVLFTACTDKKDTPPPPIDPEFSQHIAGFTSGVISRTDAIVIQLTEAIEDSAKRAEITEMDIADFDPDIEGSWSFDNNHILKFTPKEMLPTSTVFDATFKLGKIAEVEDKLEQFDFRFETMQQHLSLTSRQLKPYKNDDLNWYYLTGVVDTRDAAEFEKVEQTLSASQEERQLSLKWNHGPEMKKHEFQIDSINRKESASKVLIEYSGKSIESEQNGSEEKIIPAIGDFSLMGASADDPGTRQVLLQFSDPLDPDQNLNGLIALQGVSDPQFVIEDNIVRLMFDESLSGIHEVSVNEGIENIMGYKLARDATAQVDFVTYNPEVKLVDQNRTILPSTDGLSFPFEAVSLRAVKVRVIKIYEDNVLQFLQNNQLSGNYQMSRVGRVIKKTTVELDPEKEKNLETWNRFYIDLEEMIKTEPGAIYRIELDFDKSHSICECEENNDLEETAEQWEDEDEEYTYWAYNDYVNYRYYGYDYSKRKDPCNKAYYMSRRPEGQNIFASDIGMIGKLGNDKSMMIAVTDLKSTDPLAGIEVELIDYQQQIISTHSTDEEGVINIEQLPRKPFLAIAKHKGQTGYLKLNSNTLSISTFDVSGTNVNDGLKGFIYGERGVWRPGDTLFLNFILQDENKILPKGHPVTFELINPKGQVTERKVKRTPVGQMYTFITSTATDAPTGNWTARIKVGGNTFSKGLRIETVKPNRLKIDLSVSGDMITAGTKDVEARLKVNWLTGATARNLKAKVNMTLRPSRTSFEDFKNFVFDDPVRQFEAEEELVFDSETDENGNASFKIDVPSNSNAPGMLNAYFSTKAFEKGGDFSVDRFSIPYSPFISFAGLKMPEGGRYGRLTTNEEHTVKIASVSSDGKPVSRSQLNVKIYKIQWRWWWHGRDNSLSNYIGKESTVPIIEGTASTDRDGMGSFDFTIDDEGWGRYLIRVEDPVSGHKTGEIFYTSWSGGQQQENPAGSTMLVFSTDKEKYEVGEKCTISFPSSGVGRALVTVESGSGVVESHWVKAKESKTNFSFDVSEEMAPNVYVNVTLIQPHQQTANDLPIRLYGVMPIMVEDPQTHLIPHVKTPESIRPNKQFELEVSEEDGREMTYTVAVVDEGLLDLTNFSTPAPWNHFYAREALGVKTWDLYDEVIGAYGARMDKLLSLGGDGAAEVDGKKEANRFKPVVLYSKPRKLKAGSSEKVAFTMPNYVGSVRVMVIASHENAYGSTHETVPVKQPLMVISSLPRVSSPTETITMPVTVFAMEKSVKDVQITVETNDLFAVEGGNSQQVRFDKTGDKTVNFDLKVARKLGVGKVNVLVKSGSEVARYDVEMNVRNPNPEVTEVIGTTLKGGETWNTNFDLPGMEETNSAVLEVSSFPPIDLGRRLNYLLTYPHGCIEQTTSGAFPQLYLDNVLDLTDSQVSRAEQNIKHAINRIRNFQNTSGGLSYWPGSSSSSDWGTTYAGHFMLEAEKRGYTLPSGFKSRWISYQSVQARNWQGGDKDYKNSDLYQAYRLFTLALAGAPEMGAMNRLRERNAMSTSGKWRLAAAYQLAGQSDVARQLVDGLTKDIEPYKELSNTYGSHWRDQAMIVETLILMGEKNMASELVLDIAKTLSQDQWLSTQTTCYSLMAISKFAGDETQKRVSYNYSFNRESARDIVSSKPLSQIELDAGKLTGNSLALTNDTENMLFVRLITKGKPVSGQEKAAESGLLMEVRYENMEGEEIDVDRLAQGTDFIAKVTLRHPGVRRYYREMALSQIFPSGWEIINTRMDEGAAVHESDIPEYRDVRDDRVYSYFDLRYSRSKTFTVLLNATYLGKYYLPAVNCQAMYDNTIYARTAGKWVEVLPLGSDDLK